ISDRDMHSSLVRFGIDGHRAQPHGASSADHAASDFAAVRHEQCTKTPVHFRALHPHILNKPNLVGSMGAFAAAASPTPSTSLVSAGSTTPSSHRRAVA